MGATDDSHKTLVLLALANFMGSLGWGIYYSVSRPYYSDILGATYTMVMIIASSEWGPGLTSTLWGYLGDRYGRNKVLPFGALAYTLSLVPLVPLQLVPLVVGIASLGWAIAWPSVLAIVSLLSSEEHVGKSYGYFAIGGSLGWGMSGILVGLLKPLLGFKPVLLLTGLLAGTAYIIAFMISRARGEVRLETVNVFKELRGALLVVAVIQVLLTLGFDFAYNLFLVHFYSDIGSNILVYGLVVTSLPAFIGALLRPLAGLIVDKIGGIKTIALVILAYSLDFMGLSYARGIYSVILWIIPVYVFYDTGMIKLASEASGREKRGTAMGIVNTGTSLAGALTFTLGPLADKLGYSFSMISASIIIISAAIPLMVLRNIYIKHLETG